MPKGSLSNIVGNYFFSVRGDYFFTFVCLFRFFFSFVQLKLFVMIVSAIITTIILFPMLLLIVAGKGDAFIAGYNTASAEERARCNVKRLRGLVATLLLVVVLAFWLPLIVGATGNGVFVITMPVTLVAAFVTIILANTWAKKN